MGSAFSGSSYQLQDNVEPLDIEEQQLEEDEGALLRGDESPSQAAAVPPLGAQQHQPAAPPLDPSSLYFGNRLFGHENEFSGASEDARSFLPILQRLANITPPFQQTKTLKCPVNLSKNSLQLIPTEKKGVYKLQFAFDTVEECLVRVYYGASEYYDKAYKSTKFKGFPIKEKKVFHSPSGSKSSPSRSRSGSGSLAPSLSGMVTALTTAFQSTPTANTSPPAPWLVRDHGGGPPAAGVNLFQPGLGLIYLTPEEVELDISLYPPEAQIVTMPTSPPSSPKVSSLKSVSSTNSLMDSADTITDGSGTTAGDASSSSTTTSSSDPVTLHPVVIVLEVIPPVDAKPTKKRVTSQITFANVLQLNDGSHEIRVTSQKILFGGMGYVVYDIFGIDTEQSMQAECVICMTELRDTVVIPCRHMCLCHQCAEIMKFESIKCPICRGPVRSLLMIETTTDEEEEQAVTTAAHDQQTEEEVALVKKPKMKTTESPSPATDDDGASISLESVGHV